LRNEPDGLEALISRRVLVTGGTGFIGRRLCHRLAELGVEVTVASRRQHQFDDALSWIAMDVQDAASAAQAFERARPDYVFHLAGHVTGGRELEHVEPTLRANLLGSLNVMAAAQGVGAQRILLAGSMEAPPAAGDDQTPTSPYAASKWATEGYARMFHKLYGCPVVTLRVFMVYGPGHQDASKLVPHVILSLLRGERPRLSSGVRRVDWIYVDDVVDAFVASAVAKDAVGGVFDVGSGALVSIRELVERLVELVDTDVKPFFGAVPDRALETGNAADLAPTEASLGWAPRIALDDGLRLTIDWFRSRDN
jgi:UDP-glucose 4-epimerase